MYGWIIVDNLFDRKHDASSNLIIIILIIIIILSFESVNVMAVDSARRPCIIDYHTHHLPIVLAQICSALWL